MEINEKRRLSYGREKNKAERFNFSLETSFDEYKTSEPLLYRCKSCGDMLSKKITGADLVCKSCNSAHKRAYDKAVLHLKNLGYQLITSESEFKASANYLVRVRCLSCSDEIDCHYRSIGRCKCWDIDEKFNVIKEKAELYNIELLFDREDYKGNYSGKGVFYYPVRCKLCGEKYEASFSNERPNMCPVCNRRLYKSSIEYKVEDYLRSKNIKFYSNYKGLHLRFDNSSKDIELDLYLPDYGIAFEFNGYYYHHSGPFGKPKYYHRDKTVLCLNKGINLYHLWEDSPEDMIISIIESKLGLTERVYARKTQIKEVDSKFFNENHVDGDCKSLKRWGLFYNNECYAAISLRVTSDGHPEIARFCNKKHFTVIGGYSKLLNHLISYCKSSNFRLNLISYCNRDLSPDPLNNFYSNYGFTLVRECSLIMKYFSTRRIDELGVISSKIYNRQVFQKFKVKGLLKDSNNLSEIEINEKLGVYPVFNSGNFRYELVLN